MRSNLRTLLLVGKRVVDFLLAIIEHFSLALTVETVMRRYWSKSAFFKGGGLL